MRSLLKVACLVASMGLITPALADEVWSSNVGRIVYAEDLGPTAVFAYGPKDDAGVIYVLGLAKVYKNRGTYDGYWAKNKAKVECSTSRPGIHGKMTPFWGRFQIRFIDTNFPSRWEAVWTYCDEEKSQATRIQATPLIGEAAQPVVAKSK